MVSIEARIRSKERSIRKYLYEVEAVENRLRGLEEFRVFFIQHKEEILRNGWFEIELDTEKYKYFSNWPNYVERKINGGGISASSLYYEQAYSPETYKVKNTVNPCGVMMFDECYPEMFQELMKAHNEKEKRLRRFYEEYGRLVFMKNNCVTVQTPT